MSVPLLLFEEASPVFYEVLCEFSLELFEYFFGGLPSFYDNCSTVIEYSLRRGGKAHSVC